MDKYLLEKLINRIEKLETEVYYLNKFKQEVERKEFIKDNNKKEKFLKKYYNKL